jgi:enhancing lycopene biosynthesis protein 2
MPKVAVCLSGCGFLDGSEIHEAVFTLLALDQAGAEIICCAPDKPQFKVVDHSKSSDVAGETRNVLVESARIARGEIKPISQIRAQDIDALAFPGGYGAALNLCTFGAEGPDCTVDPDVESLVSDMVEMKKPIAAICIAPAMLARILGRKNIPAQLTIGTDADTAAALNKMGVKHCECPATEAIVDSERKVVSTPAYMLGKGPAEVHAGITKCVTELLRMIG